MSFRVRPRGRAPVGRRRLQTGRTAYGQGDPETRGSYLVAPMGREPFERVGACQTLACQTAPTALVTHAGNDLAVISDGVRRGRPVTRVIYGEGGFTWLDAEIADENPCERDIEESTSPVSTACSTTTLKQAREWTSPGGRAPLASTWGSGWRRSRDAEVLPGLLRPPRLRLLLPAPRGPALPNERSTEGPRPACVAIGENGSSTSP